LSHSKASRIGSASSRQATTRPVLLRSTSPASDKTARCFITAGSDIVNGAARSLTERSGFSASRITIARRVGSESAAKVRSRGAFENLTIWFSIKGEPVLSMIIAEVAMTIP